MSKRLKSTLRLYRLLLGAALLAGATTAHAQTAGRALPWDWVTPLRHPTLNGSIIDQEFGYLGTSAVADSAGNAYVAGVFQGNVQFGGTTLTTGTVAAGFVAKRSATGQWLWARALGPRTGYAQTRLALDPRGNLVIAGGYVTSMQFDSVATLPLVNGVSQGLFVARMSPQGRWLSAVGTGLAADSGSYSQVQLADLALDEAGNAYLTGAYDGTLRLGPDSASSGYSWGQLFVTKVTPGGRWCWLATTRVATAQGQGPSITRASHLAMGAPGHLHVTGSFGNTTASLLVGSTVVPAASIRTGNDFTKFVAHLDTAGHWLGARQLGFSWDPVVGMVADRHDNLYLTNAFEGAPITIGGTTLTPPPGAWGRYLLRLDSAGTVGWARVLPQPTPIQPSYVPASGFLTLGANQELHLGVGPRLLRFAAATGQPEPESSLGAFSRAEINQLALDPRGRVVVTGTFSGVTTLGGQALLAASAGGDNINDAFVVTLDPATGQWLADAAQTQIGGRATPVQVATDGRGHTYAAGHFTGTVTFGNTTLRSAGGSDVFITQLDAAGQPLWAERAGGPRSETVTALAVDASGNVTIAGQADTLATFGAATFPKPDHFVARLTPARQWAWATAAPAGLRALAAGRAGGVVVGGNFSGALQLGNVTINGQGGTDGYLAQFDAAGQLEWGQAIGGVATDSVTALAADRAGNLVVAGSFNQTIQLGGRTLTAPGSISQLFIGGLTPMGQWRWAETNLPNRYFAAQALAVGLSPAGDQLRVMATADSLTGNTFERKGGFVAALDPATGQTQWTANYVGEFVAAPHQLAVDGQGNAYALLNAFGGIFGTDTGYYRAAPPRLGRSLPAGHRVRGGGPLPPPLLPALAYLSSTGQWQWLSRPWAACATDSAGHLFVVGALIPEVINGDWTDTITLGPLTVRTTPQPVGVVAALTTPPIITGTLAAPAADAPALTLWPNPAHGTVQLGGLLTGQPVRVLDSLGRVVRTATSGAARLSLGGLAPGIYIVRCGAAARRLVVE